MEGASSWIGWLMTVNPMTYGVTALRRAMFAGQTIAGPAQSVCWAVTLGFGLLCFALAARQASKPSAEALS